MLDMEICNVYIRRVNQLFDYYVIRLHLEESMVIQMK